MIRGDSTDENGDPTFCKPNNIIAKLSDSSSKNPQLVLCDSAFSTKSKSVSGDVRQLQDVCNTENFGELRVLGGTFIRLYTQYEALVGKKYKTDDYAYGATQAQQLMERHEGDSAVSNSDSYNIFATDLYWTKYCQGRPKVLERDFTNKRLEFVRSGIDDAFVMVNVLLNASNTDKELFMKVHDKYFPRSNSHGDDPDEGVMGWSSLSYMYLKNIKCIILGYRK